MMRGMNLKRLSVLLALVGSAAAADNPATISLSFLSPEIANRIVVSATQECTKRGYKVAAAVVSRDGHLLAFLRSPLSGPHTVEVSQRKAYTAATLQTATSQLQSRSDLNF